MATGATGALDRLRASVRKKNEPKNEAAGALDRLRQSVQQNSQNLVGNIKPGVSSGVGGATSPMKGEVAAPVSATAQRTGVQAPNYEEELKRLEAKRQALTVGLDLDGAAEVQGQIDQLKRENGTSFLQRVGNTLSGAGKQMAAGYSDAASTLYEAGQNPRSEVNEFLLDEYKRRYETAERGLRMMREDNAVSPGTWSQGDLQGQENILADAKRKLDAMGVVVNEKVQERATTAARDFNQQLSESGAKDTEKAKEGLGGAGRFMVDAATGLVQLGGDIAAGVATGGGASASLVMRAFGGGAMKARQDGATLKEQLAYGGLTALTELLTEKIGSVGRIQTKAFGKGGLDDIFEGVVAAAERAGKTPAGRAVLNRLASAGTGFLSEGLEETVSAIAEPIIAKVTYGKDLPDMKQWAQDAFYDFLVGGAIGAVTGGAGGTDTTKAQRASAENAQDEVRMLPTAEEIENAASGTETAERSERDTYTVVTKLQENIPALGSMQAVAQTSANVVNTVGGNTMAEKARKLFETVKGVVTRPNFGEIEINGRSVKDDLSHGVGPAKAATIAAVPAVIREGQQIYFKENWKGRGYDGYVFAAPVTMDGKTVYVAAVVTQTSKNRFYLHEVVDSEGNIIKIDDGESATPTSLVTNGDAGAQTPSSITDTTIPHPANSVNSAPEAHDDVRLLPTAEEIENAASGTETAAEDDVPGLAAPEVEEDGDADADPADAIPDEDVALPIVPTNDPKVQREWNRAAKIAHNFGCQLQVGKPDGGGEGSYLNGVITIDPNCKNPVMQVLLHELTHRMENSKLYTRFVDTVKRYMTMDMGVDIDAVKEQIRKKHLEQGKQLTPEGMEQELVAYFTQEHLFQKEKYVQRLLREDRSLFDAILDWLQDAVAWMTGKEKQDILRAQRMFEKALRTSDPKMGMGEAQNIIETLPDGKKYVKADRQVVSGSDPEEWRYQLQDYINGKIRKGENVSLIAADGDELVLTSDTAGKVSSLYQDEKRLSDEMYELKVNAGSHIDELTQISVRNRRKPQPDKDGKHGEKAEDGWHYRTAYFQDFDRKYYKCTISVEMGVNGNAVYNIGKMEKSSFPTVPKALNGSSVKDGAQRGKTASADIIRNNAGGVNKKNSPSTTYYTSMADAPADEVRHLPTAEEIENGAQNSFGLSFDEMAQESRNAAEPGVEKWERDAAKEAKAPLDELMRLYENAAGFTSEEDSWSGSPDEERMREVEAMISAGTETERKGLRESLGESWSYFKRKMVDAGDSVTQFAKAVKDDYLYAFYNFARSSASAGVNMINGEQRDVLAHRVGDSLNAILDPVRKKGKDYYNQFQMYMFDLHNIDRMSIGEKAALDRMEAEQALAEFDHKYPGVAQLTEDRLRRNAENRLDLEGSALARERLKLLRKLNRADRMGNKPVFDWDITAQKSKARAEQLLREHPEFAEYQQKVRKYIRNLMQYRVDSGLITAEDAAFLERYYPNYVPTYRRTVKGLGARDHKSLHVGKTVGRAEGGTEKLQPLHEALGKQTMQVVREGSKNRFGARLLADYLNDPRNEKAGKYILGAQEYEAEFGLDSIDRAETEWKKDNTFTVYENGKLFEIQMDPSMFDAIKALYPSAMENNVVVKAIRAGNNLFKALVTGYNPTFTIRNTIRDPQTAGLYTRNAVAFLQNYPQALWEIKNNGNYWKRYQALGGSFSSVFDYQTGTVKEPKGKLGKLAAKMEALNMAMEQAPRLAEFMSVVKAGDGSMENMMDAMHAAADVTVNFGRAGTLGKVLNANFVPFLNPGIQGFDKLVRRVVQNKGAKEWAKLAVRAAVLGVAPSLLNALLYDDDEGWEDLKDSDKDTNYLFKIGDGLWLKIPKGRELSILGMTADRITDMVDGKEVDWSDFIATVGNQVAPANPLEQNILKSWFDTDLFDASSPGRTWYGGDIESQRLRKYAPGERYDSSVDTFSKWVGKQLNLSPKKINYLLDQYSGVLGDFVLPLLTPQAERDPFTKAFTVDSVSSNRISNEFYDVSDELMYTKNSGNATAKVVDRFWNKQEDACTELYADIRAIEEDPDLSDKEKKQQVRETRVVLNGIQKNALAVLPTYQKAVKKHLTGSSDEEIDRAYREANRECFGAEYAIKTYNKDVHAKATEAKESGISFNTYYEYYFAKKGLKKKAEVMAVIKKLDIPWEQKDALYLLEGYSEKTIDETPWYMERWTLPAP